MSRAFGATFLYYRENRCLIFTSTCWWWLYPEPDRLSGASESEGQAFTLDSLRARGIIVTQVEASENITHPLSVSGDSHRIL
jgi:hypothetical protein